MRASSRAFGLLSAGALLLAAGFWFGYPELAVLGCACLVAVAAALVFVAWKPSLEIVRLIDPDRLNRGEVSRVTLVVTNTSRMFGASLVARDRVGPVDAVRVPLVRLRPGRATTVRYPVPTNRRGVIDLGPIEISRRDPLGLVSVLRAFGPSGKVWVRPRQHPIAAIPAGQSRSLDGRIDKVPHGSITFAMLREYVVGDDLRRVHWRHSARVGELMVREQVDTSLPRVVLLVDDRAGAHTSDDVGESTFEAVCEAAASLLVAAVTERVNVELVFVVGSILTDTVLVGGRAREQAAVGPLLDLLAEAELVPEWSQEALQLATERLRVRRMGDTLIFLTGPPNHDDLGVVAGLKGAYPSIIAGVFGPVEAALSTSAGVLVVGAGDGAEFAATWDGVRAW